MNPGTGPDYPDGPVMRWQDNRTIDYRVQRATPGLSWFNNVPYDRNWGRSMFTPWDTALYPKAPINAVTHDRTPAGTFSVHCPTTYQPISYDPVTPETVASYDNLSRKLW